MQHGGNWRMRISFLDLLKYSVISVKKIYQDCANWRQNIVENKLGYITFPTSSGNTISPVAELTIRILVMEPKIQRNKISITTRSIDKSGFLYVM